MEGARRGSERRMKKDQFKNSDLSTMRALPDFDASDEPAVVFVLANERSSSVTLKVRSSNKWMRRVFK